MKEIYLLSETYEVNDETWYTNHPVTFAESMEEVREIFSNLVEYKEMIHPDLEVLANDDEHLHLRYFTDDGTKEHSSCVWVNKVMRNNCII